MIRRLQLFRNIGKFDSVDSAAHIPLERSTLLFAENGRGKTTLTAILRSLATGDPIPIAERHRLAAQHAPHVVLDCDGGPPLAIFENGTWSRTLSNIMVFDDLFVEQNVYSGLVVGPEQRQNLHELILGAQGVTLNHQLQRLVTRIEEHNTALRTRSAAIPVREREGLSVDEFCDLQPHDNVEEAIQESERNLAAVREQESVRKTPLFDVIYLPPFDLPAVESVLQQGLPTLDAAAAARVQEHVARIGPGGETWVGEGMRRLVSPDTEVPDSTCPFCTQGLAGSPIIVHYRAYFSEAYSNLKDGISSALTGINRTHGGNVPAAFERAVRLAGERCQFWSRFCDVPELEIDTAAIIRDWQSARDSIIGVLTTKQSSPLERMVPSQEVVTAVAIYEAHRQRIEAVSNSLEQTNATIRLVKERAAAADLQAITHDLSRLRALRARQSPTIAPLCQEYLQEKAAKVETERMRDQARTDLDTYRTNIFPRYQTAVNIYLERFNAEFRLSTVTPVQTRGGPTCTYNVIINNIPVPVSGAAPVLGQPSFRNTLSSGDRNTLALAFFFASLDQDPALARKIVVIDDPASSLDATRSLTTVQEIRRLVERTEQVIILSHNKPLLCRIWEGLDHASRTALQAIRNHNSSTLQVWAVDQDCVTEHDRRNAILRGYLANGDPNNREVARSIRPHLEAFLRVACPEHFPPGTLLGPFCRLCAQRMNTPEAILDANTAQNLADLIEYSNRFHHDTNPAWEAEIINDGELAGFVRRTLEFTKP